MRTENNDCFPFMCLSPICDTEEEAWTTFKKEARRQFKWINGFKVWRTSPKLESLEGLEGMTTVHRVAARAIAVLDLNGIQEATIDAPYTSIADVERQWPAGVALGLKPAKDKD